jgi:multidrug efflux pump subunit AcrA (membrane-fusion protein)
MNGEAPRQVQLRQDLRQSWQQHQGKSYLVVQDPVARRYFRFTEQQAAIVELLTEATTIEALAVRASAKLGGNLPASAAAAFCDSLESKDLLDTPAVHERLATPVGAGARRRRSSIFYKQVASFDPTPIFDWAQPRTRWVFTPAFQIVGCVLIACGLGIFWLNWSELTAATPNLLSFWTLLLVWPVVFSVSAFHEFCHGLTCRHFGGEVKETGFMLIYFSPAFYCDVSDAWMFRSRRQRMAVTLAGGYGQLMLWGLCTIVWRVTDPSAAINHVALVVVLFAGLQTLFNANPLIKLDGYYMLSDYLEIPNLRAKAFQALGRWVGRDPRRGKFREQRTLLIYGSSALVFSATLLLAAFTAIYTWATERWGTAGLVGFALFSTLTLRKTAVGSLSGLKAVASFVSTRKFVTLAVLGILLLVSIFGRWELNIPATFQLVAENEAWARAETDGVVTEVLVREGDRVRKNDVLARTRDFAKQTEIEKTAGELQQKQSALDRLLAGARPQEIAQQQSRIAAKQMELQNARPNQQERQRLGQVRAQRESQLELLRKVESDSREGVREGVFPQIRLDEAESAVKVKQAEIAEIDASLRVLEESASRETELRTKELNVLQSELTLMRAGNRPELIRETRAEIAKLETLLASLNQEVGRAEIRAPIDGTVVTEFPERSLNQKLTAGTNFIRLVDTAGLVAAMSVPELELEDVKVGNSVSLRMRSLPTLDIPARVDFIAPVGREENGIRVVTVRAKVAAEDPNLKPDISGVARIHGGERRIIDLITRRVRRWVRTDLWHLLP